MPWDLRLATAVFCAGLQPGHEFVKKYINVPVRWAPPSVEERLSDFIAYITATGTTNAAMQIAISAGLGMRPKSMNWDIAKEVTLDFCKPRSSKWGGPEFERVMLINFAEFEYDYAIYPKK